MNNLNYDDSPKSTLEGKGIEDKDIKESISDIYNKLGIVMDEILDILLKINKK